MENSPATLQRRRLIPALLLAGVFLAALVTPFAFRAHTMDIPGAEGTGTGIAGIFEGIGEGIGAALTGHPAEGTASAGIGGSTAEAATASLPLKLIIPKLGINSNIQYVGVTADGNMDTPKSAVDVAWYKLGSKPGETGNAVIAGHINTRYSAHGVFEHLETLVPGDTVQVLTKDGKTLTFQVTAKKFLPYNVPSTEVFGATSGRHLNLITCAGTWQAAEHSYDKRLVVFTELVK